MGGAGASGGALPQEVREKPASAAIRPRTVANFIVIFFVGFVLYPEEPERFFGNQAR